MPRNLLNKLALVIFTSFSLAACVESRAPLTEFNVADTFLITSSTT
jgi:hypothetical protein